MFKTLIRWLLLAAALLLVAHLYPGVVVKSFSSALIAALVLGLLTWGLFLATPAGEEFPAQLAGVLASLTGMLVGSLGPQAIRNTHSGHHKLVGAA